MNLRPYQREAVDAVYDFWRNGGGNGIIVIPTGGGKSLIQAQLIKEIQENWSARILVLTHVKELIKQNYDELLTIWPQAPAGMYSAGLKRRDLHTEVLFAGIQSIDKHVHKLDPPPEIVMVDECHLIPSKDNTRYKRTLTTLKMMYPNLRVVGLTATPYRLDSGRLYGKDDSIFDDVIYEVDILHLIDNGWLAPVVSKGSRTKIDTAGIKITAGDYNQKQLQARAMDTTANAVLELQKYGEDRKKWLIFAAGIEHAYQIQEYLQVKSEVVTGDTGREERDRIVKEYKRGGIRALINVGVFTTGFNVRDVDMVAMLRPTQSTSLYVQMVGRGMRTFPGKDNCLLLDFGTNVERHGPVDKVNIKETYASDGEGIPPGKECPNPECYSIIHAAVRECPDCGYQFPDPELKIKNTASKAAVLSNQIAPQIFSVQKTVYKPHIKPGRPISVRIDFYCGIQVISKWVSPENTKARYFYDKWCAAMGMKLPYPKTAFDFIDAAENIQAEKIEAIKNGKYWEVKRAKFVHPV